MELCGRHQRQISSAVHTPGHLGVFGICQYTRRKSAFPKLKSGRNLSYANTDTYKHWDPFSDLIVKLCVTVYMYFITSLPVNLQGGNAGASSLYLAGSFPKWYLAKSISSLWDTPEKKINQDLTKYLKSLLRRIKQKFCLFCNKYCTLYCICVFTSSCSQHDPWPLVVGCNILHKVCSVYSSVTHTSHA